MPRQNGAAQADPKQVFTLRAIEACKRVNAEGGHPERKGMHVVFSGFNEVFVEKFGEPSRATTDAMVEAGLIAVRPSRGGPTIYATADAPEATTGEKVKAAMRGL